MYNTKFLLENGVEIYPGYLSPERRKKLKERFADTKHFMRCGCRPDANLYYRISENLRIYPEHNNYKHDMFCCRYKDISGMHERQTAYMVSDDGGDVVAYTSFDPLNFTQAVNNPKEQDNLVPDEEENENIEEVIIGKDDGIITPAQKKEPKLSLGGLIRSINVDAFTEKVLNGQIIASKDWFSTFVYYRMKKVRLARTKKSIGDLSLEKDGCRFIYLPFAGIKQTEDNGVKRCYLLTKAHDGKIYNSFIFPDIMRKAAQEFTKTYGIKPDENTMVAGFQYLKKNKSGRSYKVMGRIQLFQTSNLGIFCRSMTEVDAFNSLQMICANNKDIRYWIPPEDDSIGAIVMFKGKARKILVLFRTKKDERVAFDRTMYVPCVVDTNMPITEERLYNIIDRPSAEEMTSEDSGDEPEEYEEELDDYEEELEDAEE